MGLIALSDEAVYQRIARAQRELRLLPHDSRSAMLKRSWIERLERELERRANDRAQEQVIAYST